MLLRRVIEKTKISFCATSALFLSGGTIAAADDRYEGPIIDMHLHAYAADNEGPPPLGVCPGVNAEAKYDPSTPWSVSFSERVKNPLCDDPIWSPLTDQELRDQTIEIMRRLNVVGVLSGTRERVAEWRAVAPELFILGRSVNIKVDKFTPQDLSDEFQSGKLEVLAEVLNQYNGIFVDDPEFAPYLEVAADFDIPVGVHVGNGPPGAPMFFKDFAIQRPGRIEPVLKKHPNLRIYLMHAGYPFTEELKAMLYFFPQLYVGTGVLQMSITRSDYYAFLNELVQAGYGDRIMFGSDQMVWPGLIEEGIDAINDAPFLTFEQKKAILHDNAARFLRLE